MVSGLTESKITGFSEFLVGCAKMNFEVDPCFLKWVSDPVPSFDAIFEGSSGIDDVVGFRDGLELRVRIVG
jgi:hypothetical protein